MKTQPGKIAGAPPVNRRGPASPVGIGASEAVALALLFAAAAQGVNAAEAPIPAAEVADATPADLTLGNFLSAGWGEPWTRRSRGEGTPDMSLLRVQTNFLSRIFRTDYWHQTDPAGSATRGGDSITGTLEYPVNRRLMLAVIGNYRWIDRRTGADTEGAAAGGFARVQLLDLRDSSVAATFRVGMPNRNLGEKDTALSLGVGGWQDLERFGFHRVGLYYHVQWETLAGPLPPGARRSDATYEIAVAKTWTSPGSTFGNATTFVEGYARTDLDGDHRSRTLFTLTPGVRATFAHRHIVMAGVEFPLTWPRPFERIVRLTYIVNF